MNKQTPLYIVDGHSLIYRSFYAIKHLSTSKGQSTNAVYGFIKILHKLLHNYNPHFMCIVFDPKGPTLRHKQFAEYKIHRKPMPDNLVSQLPFIFEVVHAYNIAMLQIEQIEADDVIAALAHQACKQDIPCVVVSYDKDIYQIASTATKILNIFSEEILGPAEIKEKMGVSPHQITDFLALTGDSSDNIPGVRGIGKKNALKLLEEFSDLEAIFKDLTVIKDEKIRKLLEEHADDAKLSKELVTLQLSIDLPSFNINNYRILYPDHNELKKIFQKLEFRKLEKTLETEITLPSTPEQKEFNF